jgi:oxygen-independent coproporphyrinogen-3 oxidase
MTDLMRVTGEHFNLREDDTGEYSIEIDPREADHETVKLLREIGFNRMSLGVQDYDARVQKAVNRIQSREITEAVLFAARDEGFRSISIDLIYGLPFQTVEGFRTTLEAVLEARPDRLSVFNYAHLPKMFKPQRRINEEDLPSASEKLDILQMVSETLADAGYLFIGMDHFARPDDELAQAQRDGTLYRNFQGYSTHSNCDLVGLGVTSIGMVGPTYNQNLRDINEYHAAIDAGRLPIQRGLELTREDRLRREVITRLICHFRLDMEQLGEEWDIDFHDHFASELERLDAMAQDGLLRLGDRHIEIAAKGRFLIRNICMVFDAYLGESAGGRFSKVI